MHATYYTAICGQSDCTIFFHFVSKTTRFSGGGGGEVSEQKMRFLIFCWPCISIYLVLNINQLDALNFIISLFQASTCFEHICSSSGGQIVLYSLWYHHIIGATKQIPNSDPKFHQPLIVDGVDKSTRASFAILNKGCLFRVGLFIILCVVMAPWIH